MSIGIPAEFFVGNDKVNLKLHGIPRGPQQSENCFQGWCCAVADCVLSGMSASHVGSGSSPDSFNSYPAPC